MARQPPTTETRIDLRTILSMGVLAVLVLACAGTAAGVGDGAEWDVYPGESIQDAIDSAGVGDTIYVHEGEYCENVDVWNRVTLVGDGADVVTVRAADAEDHVFNVTVDWVNVSGFAVAGAGYSKAGIHLSGVYHCNISSNNCSNNYYGIHLSYSSNNILTGNIANSNNDGGIWLGHSSNNMLANNNCSNNDIGIELRSSSDNTLANNNLIDNTCYNAYDNGTNIWDSGSAGNYYSDYTGADNNTDGIGDDPHPIPGGGSIDRFPLMQPWSVKLQKGDLNSDGILTPADAAIVLRLASTGAHNPAADVSGDGRVTSLDALMILQAAAGSIEL